jgi:hypothetical protein
VPLSCPNAAAIRAYRLRACHRQPTTNCGGTTEGAPPSQAVLHLPAKLKSGHDRRTPRHRTRSRHSIAPLQRTCAVPGRMPACAPLSNGPPSPWTLAAGWPCRRISRSTPPYGSRQVLCKGVMAPCIRPQNSTVQSLESCPARPHAVHTYIVVGCQELRLPHTAYINTAPQNPSDGSRTSSLGLAPSGQGRTVLPTNQSSHAHRSFPTIDFWNCSPGLVPHSRAVEGGGSSGRPGMQHTSMGLSCSPHDAQHHCRCWHAPAHLCPRLGCGAAASVPLQRPKLAECSQPLLRFGPHVAETLPRCCMRGNSTAGAAVVETGQTGGAEPTPIAHSACDLGPANNVATTEQQQPNCREQTT